MVNQTRHGIIIGDARDMAAIPDDAVDLVVTSPPYPMIELWDDTFAHMDADIQAHLDAGDGDAAFTAMHEQLNTVWNEVSRVTADNGIVVVNIGDAARSVDDTFQLYPNRSEIITTFRNLGFQLLPSIYWSKPTNASTKFMGSGCLPPNQYTTLEHEHILIFRNGDTRDFEPHDTQRYESAYFYEERNKWFTDHWEDITGVRQSLDLPPADIDTDADTNNTSDDNVLVTRTRSGAFPLAIPYRLIHMFSVYDDTILDPFMGTGTTNIAAMISGRNSIGIELNPDIADLFDARTQTVPELSRNILGERIDQHQQFVTEQRGTDQEATTDADNYPFPVTTQQEKHIQFYEATDVDTVPDAELASTFADMGSIDDADGQGYSVTYEEYARSIPARLFRYEED